MKRQAMETAGLEWFAEVGIIIFFSVFVLVAIRLFFMKKESAEELGRIPLDDEVENLSDDEVTV